MNKLEKLQKAADLTSNQTYIESTWANIVLQCIYLRYILFVTNFRNIIYIAVHFLKHFRKLTAILFESPISENSLKIDFIALIQSVRDTGSQNKSKNNRVQSKNAINVFQRGIVDLAILISNLGTPLYIVKKRIMDSSILEIANEVGQNYILQMDIRSRLYQRIPSHTI